MAWMLLLPFRETYYRSLCAHRSTRRVFFRFVLLDDLCRILCGCACSPATRGVYRVVFEHVERSRGAQRRERVVHTSDTIEYHTRPTMSVHVRIWL